MSQSEDAAYPLDPGWGPGLRLFLLSFITLGMSTRKRRNLDGLSAIRILFLSLLLAGFLMLFVLAFAVSGFGDPDPSLALVEAGLGLAGIAGAAWSRRRPLDATDADLLARSYGRAFFLGFAFSEAPLLVAFALSELNDEFWPFVVALPFYVVGMVLIAPGKSNLARHQQRIHSGGSLLSIVDALMKSATSPRRT